MIAGNRPSLPRLPAHFRPVGGALLLASIAAAWDYAMINSRDPAYIAPLSAAAIQTIDEWPLWAMIGWSVGVAGAMAGAILLLPRLRLAVPALALALAGLGAGAAGGLAAQTVAGKTGLAAAIVALPYAVWLRRRGLLRPISGLRPLSGGSGEDRYRQRPR